MLDIYIPGYKTLIFHHLVMDYNGTLAVSGQLIDGVRPRLISLAEKLQVHVVTADTFGMARSQLEDLPCELAILSEADQSQAKLTYIQHLGVEGVAAIGNGRNDRLMLAAAGLGIAVIQEEGASRETCLAAQVLAPDILAALDLLLIPRRLIATLRS